MITMVEKSREENAMALREIDEGGRAYDVEELPHKRDFERVWLALGQAERDAMEAEINHRLTELVTSPSPNWGTITNTSIEGGRMNSDTGIRGDWSGTVFEPIFDYLGDEQLAGMFYGNVWKKVIIARPELWIGIRFDPTFPQRGITLQGKTYFRDNT
jgi:hypothetical protein